jgi:protein ImuA
MDCRGIVEPDQSTAALIAMLKSRIARLERPMQEAGGGHKIVPFGIPAIDGRLPGGGLWLGALHEVAGGGPDLEHGAAAALLAARLLARLPGPVLWVLGKPDLFAPALDAVGLHPDRVIYAEAGRSRAVLPTMEEGLRHAGLAGVVGEVPGRLTLTASRRLQLAAEQSGVICLALRRDRGQGQGQGRGDALLAEPTAAMTRWRISPLPSPPPLAHSPDTPGLGWPRWRLELLRCRGGEPASWIVEASDESKNNLPLSAKLADRPAAAALARRHAAVG